MGRRWILGTLCVAALSLMAGCPNDAGEGADGTTTAPYAEGRVHMGGKRVSVVPFIGHSVPQDLLKACALRAEAEKAAGNADATPCYNPTMRKTFTVIRLEQTEGFKGSAATRALASRNEGAHFIVEPSGSVYQILDLAHAARRDGVWVAEEVRILSGSAVGAEKLVAGLKGQWPNLRVETVEAPAVAKAPKANPSKGNVAPARGIDSERAAPPAPASNPVLNPASNKVPTAAPPTEPKTP